MSKNLARRRRFTIKQDSNLLQINILPKNNFMSILHSAIILIILFVISAISTLNIVLLPVIVILLGFSIFNFLREMSWNLLGKEIIRVDRDSLEIVFKVLNHRLEKYSFDQAKISNFQVCCFILQQNKPIKKNISESEEIYALSLFCSEEGGIIFAKDLNEQDIKEVMQLVQSYMPSISYHWEINEEKLTWLIQILTEFALLSRYGKRNFNDLLLLSNIPDGFIRSVFRANPWLSIYLDALASNKKPPLLDGVPILYTEYLELIWRAVAANEDTVWDVIRSIPKSLLKPIVKRN